MARIPLIESRESLAPEHQPVFDSIAQSRGRLGERGLVELTATVGYYAMLACTLNAFDVATASAPEDLKI